MKASDRYHKWVEWNVVDQAYVGKCPDLITGLASSDLASSLPTVDSLPRVLGACGRYRSADAWREVESRSLAVHRGCFSMPRVWHRHSLV